MGALAAIGLVLCAGVAGDATRPRALRAAAAAAAPLLGAGLALTFSRGALLAAAAGLASCCWRAPARAAGARRRVAGLGRRRGGRRPRCCRACGS